MSFEDLATRHDYRHFNDHDRELTQGFLSRGYVIVDAERPDLLDALIAFVAERAAAFLNQPVPEAPGQFLDCIHQYVDVDRLNGLRLAVIQGLRDRQDWFMDTYYRLAARALEALIGNELAMQRSVGLSVQLPDDESSLLPIHADVWDGDSPYEVVMWLPLVDCHSTKSMYLLDLPVDRRRQQQMREMALTNAEDLFLQVQEDAHFVTVPKGKVLLFSQTLMHGNRVNRTSETRWSMNCRFKSLLSPYADKKLIETFQPLNLRAATRIGMNYQLPRLKGG